MIIVDYKIYRIMSYLPERLYLHSDLWGDRRNANCELRLAIGLEHSQSMSNLLRTDRQLIMGERGPGSSPNEPRQVMPRMAVGDSDPRHSL
jgi:hypothetical protein